MTTVGKTSKNTRRKTNYQIKVA